MPTTPNDPARSKRFLLAILAILGIVLLLVGWFRWATS
jgi:hypothetical protein